MSYDHTSEELEDGTRVISALCSVKNERYEVRLSREQYERWKSGAYIQDSLSELDAYQREFLISWYTPAEFEKAFGHFGDED